MARNRQKQKGPKKSFDEAALANLTATIDKNLDKSGDSDRSGKRKRQDGASGPLPKKRQIQTDAPRDRAPKGGKGDNGKKHSGKLSTSQLLEEIRALGGNEEDLELVTGIDSDAEEGAPKEKPAETTVDNSFKNELAKFASSLGFENLPEDDAETDEEDAQDEGREEGPEDNGQGEKEDEEEWEEEEEEEEEEPEPVEEPQRGKKGKQIFEPRADWYGVSTEGMPAPTSDDIKPYAGAIANLKAYAKTLLEEDAASFKASQGRNTSSQKFMSTIMTSGTLSDKVSALTLSIQESPVHNIRTFESLVTLASKKSRGQAIAALGALVDLLSNGMVLPNDRRLRLFNAQPALLGTLQKRSVTKWTTNDKLPGKVSKRHLIMWAYEDWLKDVYFRLIQVLEVWCNDEIEYSRSRALDFVYGLLKDKPEQEANLLRLLINKLGDRDRKIASRASYCLLQLLNLHPGMKPIVIKSIEQELLLRPGQSVRTKYYAINTLNQTILSAKEPSVADTLVRIYFETFMALLKSGSLGSLGFNSADPIPDKGSKKDKKRRGGNGQSAEAAVTEVESSEKLVSAVLTGVNRAIPFAMTDDTTLQKHLDTLFRITHSSNFNTSIQALMLIQQLATTKHIAVDRYYRTLYESLLDPRLITSSKQALYLNLLYRSLKNDVDVRRVKAFVKRMLQVLNLHQPSFACGILYLAAELEGTFPDLKTLITEPEAHEEDEEEVFKDVVEGEPDQGAGTQGEEEVARKNAYDGRKRDPEYSNAQRSCLWELTPFFSHFHPSVAIFASNLLVRQKSLPKPELANHTLMHFLDKFVYRNPKSTESSRGGSIMQPVLAAGSSSHIVSSGKFNAKAQTIINSASFWNLRQNQVAAEDVFFHEYFAQVGKPGQSAKTKKERKQDEKAGSDDEEAEDEIWDALVNSRPEVGGGDELDDSDIDMEDYEDSEDDLDLGDEDEPGMGEGSDDGFEGIFDDSDEEEDESGEEAEDKEEEEGVKSAVMGKPTKGRLNRKEMKALPMFASVDDYAEMLEDEEDGMDGQ
ncbi:CBF-domain-containing protein [Thozetella sp. PMI_491]|nr:CBF-domain-containing protein [Thozetella sp. PMI_491]